MDRGNDFLRGASGESVPNKSLYSLPVPLSFSPVSCRLLAAETGGADPARGRRRLQALSWPKGVWPLTSLKRAPRESEDSADEEENEVHTEFELPFDAFPLMMDHNGQLLGLKEKATRPTPKGRRGFGLPASFF